MHLIVGTVLYYNVHISIKCNTSPKHNLLFWVLHCILIIQANVSTQIFSRSKEIPFKQINIKEIHCNLTNNSYFKKVVYDGGQP